MKTKKVISLLLALTMAFTLFSGLSSIVMADDTTTYTEASGFVDGQDYIIGIWVDDVFYAMANSSGSISYVALDDPTAGTSDTTAVWSAASSSQGYGITNDSYYLYYDSSNLVVSLTTSDKSRWAFSEGALSYTGQTTYYVSGYSDGTFTLTTSSGSAATVTIYTSGSDTGSSNSSGSGSGGSSSSDGGFTAGEEYIIGVWIDDTFYAMTSSSGSVTGTAIDPEASDPDSSVVWTATSGSAGAGLTNGSYYLYYSSTSVTTSTSDKSRWSYDESTSVLSYSSSSSTYYVGTYDADNNYFVCSTSSSDAAEVSVYTPVYSSDDDDDTDDDDTDDDESTGFAQATGFTDGQDYIIGIWVDDVFYAMANNSGTLSYVALDDPTGEQTDTTIIWTASAGEGYGLINGSYYLYYDSSNLVVTLTTSSKSRWSYSSSSSVLGYSAQGTSYYVSGFSDGTFTLATSSSSAAEVTIYTTGDTSGSSSSGSGGSSSSSTTYTLATSLAAGYAVISIDGYSVSVYRGSLTISESDISDDGSEITATSSNYLEVSETDGGYLLYVSDASGQTSYLIASSSGVSRSTSAGGYWTYSDGVLAYYDGSTTYYVSSGSSDAISVSEDSSEAGYVYVFTGSSSPSTGGGSSSGGGGSSSDDDEDEDAPTIDVQPEAVDYVIEDSDYDAPEFSVTASLPDDSTATTLVFQWFVGDDDHPITDTVEAEVDENLQATNTISAELLQGLSAGVYQVYCKVTCTVDDEEHSTDSDLVSFIVTTGVKANSYITFSDVHQSPENVGYAIDEFIETYDGQIPALIICTGDWSNGSSLMSGDRTSSNYTSTNEYLDQIVLQVGGIDMVFVSGNHDNTYSAIDYTAAAGLADTTDYAEDGVGVIYDSEYDSDSVGTSASITGGVIVYGICFGALVTDDGYSYESVVEQLSEFLANLDTDTYSTVIISAHAGLHVLGIQPESISGGVSTAWSGDESYNIDDSAAMVELLNEYADTFDITFYFGHNHSKGESEFTLTSGDTIYSTVSFSGETDDDSDEDTDDTEDTDTDGTEDTDTGDTDTASEEGTDTDGSTDTGEESETEAETDSGEDTDTGDDTDTDDDTDDEDEDTSGTYSEITIKFTYGHAGYLTGSIGAGSQKATFGIIESGAVSTTRITASSASEIPGTHVYHVHDEDTVTAYEYTEATCEEDGNYAYYYCSVCDLYYSDEDCTVETTVEENIIPALGHDYVSMWTWSDEYDVAVLILICKNDTSHVVTQIIYTEAETTDATCTEDGVIVYTATVTYDDVEYTKSKSVAIEAYGHSYEAVVTDPTCTEAGYTTYTCTVCGDTYVDDEVDALGHSYEAEVTDPTCTEGGYTTYTCTVCGDTYVDDEVAALGHSYEATVTDPTCTEDGYTTYVCSVCGDTYVADETEATGHSYTEVVTDPTCTEDGSIVYTCIVCGDTYTEILEATGHTEGEEVIENNVDPTCTEEGSYDTVVYCTVCGEELSRETVIVEALGHTEGEEVIENNVDPTCTEEGSYDVVVYCTVCGEELSRETTVVPATGHTESEAVIENNVDPTCTEEGSYDTVVYCTVCGEELSRETTVVPATGHSYEAVVTDPTCTEGGYTTYTCSVCGDSYVADETEALGHSYEAAVTEPTCTEGGYTTYTCTVCGDSYVADETEALGHSYEAVVTEPTCTEGGYTTYTCTVCGDSYVADETEALGHSYEAVVTDPTCTEDGSIVYTCTVCGDTYTEILEATGHSYEAVVTDPTCTEGGYTTYTCTVCGDSYVADETEALGHDYVITESVEPTETETGYAVYTCTRCDDTYTVIIPATGTEPETETETETEEEEVTELTITFTSSTGASVTAGEALEFSVNGVYEELIVSIDGTVVESAGYTLTYDEDGNTIVTISAEYIATLASGASYTLTVSDTEGLAVAEAEITVEAAAAQTETEAGSEETESSSEEETTTASSSDDSTSPTTGDSNSVALWMSLAALGVIGLAFVSFKRKFN